MALTLGLVAVGELHAPVRVELDGRYPETRLALHGNQDLGGQPGKLDPEADTQAEITARLPGALLFDPEPVVVDRPPGLLQSAREVTGIAVDARG